MRSPVLACAAVAPLVAALLLARPARADSTLHLEQARLDPPTVITLGVQLLITGDDDFNATVAMRYRKTGGPTWSDAMPLFRVHPELVVARTVAPQFAGSIFELDPDTGYDIELHAVDVDGSVDQMIPLQGRTRPVPVTDPAHPHAVPVTDAASLQAALGAAKPGDVITLAAGTYAGTFQENASGTAADPIVIRGVDRDTVILDGQGCTGCNEIDVYGSFVHIERLTVQNVERAVRWQTMGATDEVLRRVHAKNTRLGIGGQTGQKNFYICDNVFEGRLVWPQTYGDDMAAHSNDDGLVVQGSGHVVCHNQISGYADSLQNFDEGTRGNDFYGNDSIYNYDDGIEFDGTEGNSRAFRNRWTNTYDALSFQPIYGGPAYAIRNVIVNVENEGMKLHALGGSGTTPSQDPVGVIALNNTFVRPYHAVQLSTPNPVHEYIVENNLFVGPDQPSGQAPPAGRTVEWDTPIDSATGTIDYNGYFSDGNFEFGYTSPDYPGFAAVKAGGKYEAHGLLLGAVSFASGLVAPADHKTQMMPQDAALAAGSPAIDRALVLANVSDVFHGAGPDLGAQELGCPSPIYGPRPEGVDETSEPRGCAPPMSGDGGVGDGGGGGSGGGGSGGGDGGASGGSGGGCGCVAAGTRSETIAGALTIATIALGLRRRRRTGAHGR